MRVKPISPTEVLSGKQRQLPSEVFEAFNELIVQKFDGREAAFTQEEVVELIVSKRKGTKRDEIFDKHWLDIEDLYRKIGWVVVYDKPAYCETYDAYFTFKRKKVL